MRITLYQAAEQVRELLDQLDESTGELPEGFEAARAVVAAKSQSVAAFVLDTEAQANMVQAHAQALLERVRSARKRTMWLREYLRNHMAACGLHQIQADDGTFDVRLERGRDESVEVFDERQIPEPYMREVPAKLEPDKTAIKRAIKEGYEVPGARVVARDRLVLK